METSTLIQASADVVRIVTLRTGDVYKRLLHKTPYGRDLEEPTLRFGVVTDVINNGSDAAITALEFDTGYSGVAPEIKVFRGGSDVAPFAATPAEVTAALSEVAKFAQRAVEDAERELAKRRDVQELVNRAYAAKGQLTEAATTTEQAIAGAAAAAAIEA